MSRWNRFDRAAGGDRTCLDTADRGGCLASLDVMDNLHYHIAMPGTLLAQAEHVPLVTDPVGVLAVLLTVLAVIWWVSRHPLLGCLLKIIPPLVFCYFVPALLTGFDVIPAKTPLYDWVKDYLLPVCLMLMVLSLDLQALRRLGPKALVTMLAGTAGVVVGGPIAFLICRPWLPDDAWRGLAALSGSWIGGAANFVAIGEAARATDEALGAIIVVDVIVAYFWLGILLWLAGRQASVDRWMGADATIIDNLQKRMSEFHERVRRPLTMADLTTLLALGFGATYLSHLAGIRITTALENTERLVVLNDVLSASTWKYIIVTAIGIVLSMTRARELEGAGASQIGSAIIYLLVTCIGAGASFSQFWQYPALLATGIIWISIHIVVLVTVALLMRAPLFFIAVGSMANVGGVVSASVVSSAFHPSLTAVGVLLAVVGYAIGTYAGLICMSLLRVAAGGEGI